MNKGLTARLQEKFAEEIRHAGILIIDMQPYFLSRIQVDDRDCMLAAQHELLTSLAPLGLPIAYVELEEEDNSSEKYGSTDFRIHGDLPRDARRFGKSKENGFTNPDLATYFKALDVSRIIAMGVYANYCVTETIRGGSEQGFNFYTAPELVANKSWQRDTFPSMLEWFKNNTLHFDSHKNLINTFLAARAVQTAVA